ncbi:MAG: hypothetical protein ACLTZE_05300, partial [Evtepia sp.]
QGARRISAGELYLSTALSACQELFQVFQNFFCFLTSFFTFAFPSRDSFDRIPPISGNVKLFFQVFSLFSIFLFFLDFAKSV